MQTGPAVRLAREPAWSAAFRALVGSDANPLVGRPSTSTELEGHACRGGRKCRPSAGRCGQYADGVLDPEHLKGSRAWANNIAGTRKRRGSPILARVVDARRRQPEGRSRRPGQLAGPCVRRVIRGAHVSPASASAGSGAIDPLGSESATAGASQPREAGRLRGGPAGVDRRVAGALYGRPIAAAVRDRSRRGAPRVRVGRLVPGVDRRCRRRDRWGTGRSLVCSQPGELQDRDVERSDCLSPGQQQERFELIRYAVSRSAVPGQHPATARVTTRSTPATRAGWPPTMMADRLNPGRRGQGARLQPATPPTSSPMRRTSGTAERCRG